MVQLGVYLVNLNSNQVSPLSSEKENVIGRGLSPEDNPEANVLLPHPVVSRKHAKIYLDPANQGWYFQDLSRHGSAVNGKPTGSKQGGPGEPVLLKHGDHITIANSRLVFYEKFCQDATMETNIEQPHMADAQQENPLLEAVASIVMLAAITFIIVMLSFLLLRR